MTTRKTPTTRFAVCIDNSEYPASLELYKIYRVLPDQEADREGDLRVVDESGEDYLYPKAYIVVLNLTQTDMLALSQAYAGVLPAR
jgi:hypothetical protein